MSARRPGTTAPPATAILEYVERVTTEGGPDYVPPAERVAVFDNDGTLWCEKPAYIQALFMLARLRRAGRRRPGLAAQPVVQALLPATSRPRPGTGARRSPRCC